MTNKTSCNIPITEELCTPSRCLDNGDKDHLICVLCKRKVHYQCSELPAYEIHRILSNTTNLYKCIDCVRVPKSLIKKLEEKKYNKINNELEARDTIIRRLRHEVSIKTNARDIIKNDLETFITEKIKDIEAKTRILIQEELSSTTKTITEASKQTYAGIVKEKEKEIKTIVKEQQEEDKREEIDIKTRRNNIILHGLREDEGETEKEQKEMDDDEVEKLLTYTLDMDEEHIKKIKTIHERIGRKGSKYRPLKVTFLDERHKQRVMKNLYKIKINAEPQYTVSVTEDYTRNERTKIKELYMKAKQLNEENNDKENTIWRVRGCPRASLYLKQLSRTKADERP